MMLVKFDALAHDSSWPCLATEGNRLRFNAILNNRELPDVGKIMGLRGHGLLLEERDTDFAICLSIQQKLELFNRICTPEIL